MDIDYMMRTKVAEDVCRKLKLPFKDNYSNKQLCEMIFMATGWDSPYYGKRQNYVEMYWRRYLGLNSPRASGP